MEAYLKLLNIRKKNYITLISLKYFKNEQRIKAQKNECNS